MWPATRCDHGRGPLRKYFEIGDCAAGRRRIPDPGVSGRGAVSPVAAQETIAFIGEPIKVNETEVEIGASIGIAVAEPGKDANQRLIRLIALYVAKSAGRNTAKVFDAGMMEFASQRASMEQALRHAIRNGGIVPTSSP